MYYIHIYIHIYMYIYILCIYIYDAPRWLSHEQAYIDSIACETTLPG